MINREGHAEFEVIPFFLRAFRGKRFLTSTRKRLDQDHAKHNGGKKNEDEFL